MDKKRKEFIIGLIVILIVIALVILISSVNKKEIAGKVVSEGGEGNKYLFEQPQTLTELIEDGQLINKEINGYIIEFKDAPLVEKKIQDKSADLVSYNSQLKSNHELAKKDIYNLLGKSITSEVKSQADQVDSSQIKLLGEYTKVFNGIALDITLEEAEKIKKSTYVKSVSPNYKVEALMMDSVPLINADDVWNMQDSQGNNITGKNITIAIIDTGIDYTHKDLGGCTQQQFLSGTCEKVIGGYDFSDIDDDPMDYHGHGTHVAGIAAGGKVIFESVNINLTSSKSGYVSQQYSTKSFSSLGASKQGLMWYGTTGQFRTSSAVHYEYFDLSSIPQNAKITSAKLYKYHDTANIGTDTNNLMTPKSLKTTNRVSLGKLTENFLETDSYKSIGNRYRNQIILPKIDKSVKNSTVTDLVLEYDIKDIVQAWVYGKPNYGFSFLGNYNSAGYGAANYYFRNAGVNSPRLEITYEKTSDISEGLKGVAPDAKLYAYKVLDESGSGWMIDVIAGIERAVDPNQDKNFSDHVDIISMSLGANCWAYNEYCGPDDDVSQAVDNAVSVGSIVIISAGNSGPDEQTIGSPGTARRAITVGASYKKDYEPFWFTCPESGNFCNQWCNVSEQVRCDYWGDGSPKIDQIVSFSSRGPVSIKLDNKIELKLNKPDIAAPGAVICSSRYDNLFPEGSHPYYHPCLDNKHVQLAGTSMSAPMVAGAVALIKQAHPDWTPEEIKSVLKNTADYLGYEINTEGFGRINAEKSIKSNNPIAILEDDYIFRGKANIKGIAKAEEFSGYSLQIGYNRDYNNMQQTGWTTIYTSEIPSENDLFTWDTSEYPDRDYMLRLLVNGSNEKSQDIKYISIRNLEIEHPKKDDLFIKDKIIEIRGTAYDKNMINFYIEVDSSNNEDIALSNQGLSPVINDVLGIWDTSKSELVGYHNIRVCLEKFLNSYETENICSLPIEIYIDPYLNENWLRKIDGEVYVPPVFEDLNKDGKEEIVFRDYSGMMYILNSSGDFISGWPKQIGDGGWLSDTTPVIVDLNNDSEKEIIIQVTDSTYVGDGFWTVDKNSVYIINSNGDYKKIILMENSINANFVGIPTISPVVADLNGDNKLEIISSFRDGLLYIIDNNGNILGSYLKSMARSIGSSPVVANFDDDSELEIAIVTQSYQEGRYLHILNMDGSEISGWPIRFQGITENPYIEGYNFLATGDIDNDGKKEIAISYEGHLTVLNQDGTIQEGNWPQKLERIDANGPVSLSDVDNDGDVEIFSGSHAGLVSGYNHDGSLINGWGKYYYLPISSFVIGNIQGDSDIDVVGGSADYNLYVTKGKIYAWDKSGVPLENWPRPINSIKDLNDNFYGTPLISDFDKDGLVDLFFVAVDGTIYLWNFIKEYNSSLMPWPQFQHDPQHTGCYDCEEEPITENICSLSVSGIPVNGFNVCASKNYNCFIEEEKSTCGKNCVAPCFDGSMFCQEQWESGNCEAPTNPGTWCNTPPGLGKIPECAPWCNVYPKEIVCQSDILAGNAGPIPTKINIASQNNFYISRSVDSSSFTNTPAGKISISGNGCSNKEVSVSSGSSVSSNVVC